MITFTGLFATSDPSFDIQRATDMFGVMRGAGSLTELPERLSVAAEDRNKYDLWISELYQWLRLRMSHSNQDSIYFAYAVASPLSNSRGNIVRLSTRWYDLVNRCGVSPRTVCEAERDCFDILRMRQPDICWDMPGIQELLLEAAFRQEIVTRLLVGTADDDLQLYSDTQRRPLRELAGQRRNAEASRRARIIQYVKQFDFMYGGSLTGVVDTALLDFVKEVITGRDVLFSVAPSGAIGFTVNGPNAEVWVCLQPLVRAVILEIVRRQLRLPYTVFTFIDTYSPHLLADWRSVPTCEEQAAKLASLQQIAPESAVSPDTTINQQFGRGARRLSFDFTSG